MEILKLIYIALQSFSNGIVSFVFDTQWIINPLLILILLLVMSQYKNMVSIQKQMYGGRVRTRLRDFVATSILAGLLAGLGGSILITVLGVTFLKVTGLVTVIIFSLLLMFFVNPRYVCLSYSGGILSVISLLLIGFVNNGWLNKNDAIIKFIQTRLDIDVSALMIIVAIMHLIEAVLMWIDGHRGAVPVFVKHKGKLVGGFVMQRLWIIPILFLIMANSTASVGQTVATPHWWPLFVPQNALKSSIFTCIPLLAMLGYSDFSISTPVVQKVRRSSIELFVFSIVLLVLALGSYKLYILKYVAALFAPIAHEVIVLYERYKESSGIPLWDFKEDGVMVVDTIPASPAEKIGIKSGDKLVGINNNPVKTIEDVLTIMSNYFNYMWIDVINVKGEKRIIEFANYQGRIKELGIITVPRDDENVIFVEAKNSNLFNKFVDKFKK